MEARILLRKERGETEAKLMEEFCLDEESFHRIEESANIKLERARESGDPFHGYEPMYPKEGTSPDW